MSVPPSTSNTPPALDADKQAKKEAKKARKLARRAEKEQKQDKEHQPEQAAPSAEPQSEHKSPANKRKADETDEERKARKAAKKAKKEAKKSAEVHPEPTLAAAQSPVKGAAPKASSADVAAFIKDNNISYEPESAVQDFAPVLSFAALPLDDGLRKGLAGFTKPTPIQSASFPITMAGRDVIGIAETG